MASGWLAAVPSANQRQGLKTFVIWFGFSWWRHQTQTFSALLAFCAGNSPATGEFPSQRPVTRSFDVLFDLCLNKRLSKQSWGWWFETPSRSLWRHCNVTRKVLTNPGHEAVIFSQILIQEAAKNGKHSLAWCPVIWPWLLSMPHNQCQSTQL